MNKNLGVSALFSDLLRSPWFLLGLLLKLVFIFLPFPGPTETLFLPFLDQAVQHPWQNPWSFSPPESFPYGSVLYVILFLPKFLLYQVFGDWALGTHALSLFALKFPVLIFDTFLFVLLRIFAGARRSALTGLYWLNPVLFYISYVHGQLDLFSIFFLLLSFYYLFSDRICISALAFTAAVLCKFHVVSVMPLVLVFIWTKEFRRPALRKIGTWLFVTGLFSFIGLIPLLTAQRLAVASLGSPEIHRLFSAQLRLDESSVLYIGFLLTMLVLTRLVISTQLTEKGLLFGSGAVFISLVLGSDPAPGWYFWVIPFLALFFCLHLNIRKILFWGLMGCYFLFYIRPFFLEIQDPFFGQLTFSLLVAALITNFIAYWIVCVSREASWNYRLRPLLIGISGDSGSGKNYLTTLILDVFGQKNTTVIEGDNYHKWERGDENWEQYTHLDPKANHLLGLIEHVSVLRLGRTVFQKVYDHKTGKYDQEVELKPLKVILVQGLHSLFSRSLRDAYHLKIFLSPEPALRKKWKIQRDVVQRGHSEQRVLNQLERRGADSEKYIESQKEHADLVIDYVEEANDSLSVKYTVWNDLDFEPIRRDLQRMGVPCELKFELDNPDRLYLKVTSLGKNLTLEAVAQLAASVLPPLRHLTRNSEPPQWKMGFDGLSQVIVLWNLYHKNKGHMGTEA